MYINLTENIQWISKLKTSHTWGKNDLKYPLKCIEYKTLLTMENEANCIKIINILHLFHKRREKWNSKNKAKL